MPPDTLTIKQRRVETSVSLAKAAKRNKEFLAPIPLEWVTRAAVLPGKALQVALAIRHQSALEKRLMISLGNVLLKRMGVNKDAKRRALAALEQEGLITVCQKNGAKPTVTII
ncbi:hypothetical protein [Desulfonatronum parangueonense]